MAELVLAVDIGGTKMAAGLVTFDGSVVEREMVETRSWSDSGDEGRLEAAELLWGDLAGLVGRVRAAAGVGDTIPVCGAGCGGPMSPGGEGVSPLNIPAWRAFPLRSRLADLTGVATYVDNDAKALALGEGWVGAAAGCANYIAMVVSTGVGGGIVLEGRLLGGRLGNAGHIGHMMVEPEGRECHCGARGCLEAEASGTAIAAITGEPARLAPAAVVERTGTLVGRAVSSVVNLLDLPLAVVSGSVALGFGAPFFGAAQEEMDRRCRLSFAGRPGGPGWAGRPRSTDRCRPGGPVRGGAGPVSGAAVRVPEPPPAGRAPWGRDAGVVARTLLRHPSLWWAAAAALRRLARRGWWHRAPFMPLPGESYWHFRRVTAYGGDGESEDLTSSDVVAYLRWCQRSRPRGG